MNFSSSPEITQLKWKLVVRYRINKDPVLMRT